MDTITEALALMQHQVELETTLKQTGSVHVSEERELRALQRRLAKLPEATEAVTQAAHALRRSIPELSVDDVEAWATPASA